MNLINNGIAAIYILKTISKRSRLERLAVFLLHNSASSSCKFYIWFSLAACDWEKPSSAKCTMTSDWQVCGGGAKQSTWSSEYRDGSSQLWPGPGGLDHYSGPTHGCLPHCERGEKTSRGINLHYEIHFPWHTKEIQVYTVCALPFVFFVVERNQSAMMY